jgi:hypothetical protein
VLCTQQMVNYWVKAESLFLLRAQLVQKLLENLTGFKSEPLLPFHFKCLWLIPVGLPVGFPTFIPPLFSVTLTHALF